jgi:hypothetical protein
MQFDYAVASDLLLPKEDFGVDEQEKTRKSIEAFYISPLECLLLQNTGAKVLETAAKTSSPAPGLHPQRVTFVVMKKRKSALPYRNLDTSVHGRLRLLNAGVEAVGGAA